MEFKLPPFPHQLEEYTSHGRTGSRMLPWEMGTGKTKVVIDEAAHLFLEKEIRGLLVVAPNGVQDNWALDEIPLHLSPEVEERTRIFLWQSAKARRPDFIDDLSNFENHEGLAILVISYDSLMVKSKLCAEVVRAFMTERQCMYVLDESQYVKAPKAKRTIRVLASGKPRYAPYRRALTGTPVDNCPFDLYTQLKFLDPSIWKQLGVDTFAAFKVFFGVWEKHLIPQGGGRGVWIDKIVRYKNLGVLNQVMSQLGRRITKEDAGLNLPLKLYSKRYFSLSPAQVRAYKQLKTEYRAWLEGTESVTAVLALTRTLRFQQITSGYLPTDSDGRLVSLGDPNPREKVMSDLLGEIPGSAILWAKFTPDINRLMELAKKRKMEAVRYDGRVNRADRIVAKHRFQSGDAQLFIAHTDCAGVGLTLHAAKTMVFYNTSYKMGKRLQAEDRAHRIGLEHSLAIIDIVARGTVDEGIIRALRYKHDVANEVTGDSMRDWI